MDIDSERAAAVETNGTINGAAKNEELWVRYKFGGAEFEAKGATEDVNQHAMTFIAIVSSRKKASSGKVVSPDQMPLFGESNTPLLPGNGVSDHSTNSDREHSDSSLLSFYLEKGCDPKTNSSMVRQHDQLLIIHYHREKREGFSQLTPADYRQAYSELGRIPVKEPRNFTARVTELIEEGYLRKIGDGYSITLKGEQRVEQMGQER